MLLKWGLSVLATVAVATSVLAAPVAAPQEGTDSENLRRPRTILMDSGWFEQRQPSSPKRTPNSQSSLPTCRTLLLQGDSRSNRLRPPIQTSHQQDTHWHLLAPQRPSTPPAIMSSSEPCKDFDPVGSRRPGARSKLTHLVFSVSHPAPHPQNVLTHLREPRAVGGDMHQHVNSRIALEARPWALVEACGNLLVEDEGEFYQEGCGEG
ncbi:hypothetical protein BDK51DRAFT_41587 [Blyttiomyces helicus]|uniref:Uncharacterized protein n=1 Tax=Blyttiomyces helicus TaxID=388810 RepID=A0A4P9WMZ8_9FUNG|nr:hypothetical protein BDK51DRAFT_41587 [Blyttiomyces helicus]|eukprot:RKO92126.1 hypothetical protein BDK51DRAFT_41587 [Blyttiomyces helicus]